MLEKNKLLKQIQMYDFCIDDISIYLDSHPNCKEGLEFFKKYNELRKVACAEYAEKYGPLSINAVNSTQKWTWISDPWPWEKED